MVPVRTPGTWFLAVPALAPSVDSSVPLLSLQITYPHTKNISCLHPPTHTHKFTLPERLKLSHRLIPAPSVSTGSKRTNWVRLMSHPQTSCSGSERRVGPPKEKVWCLLGGDTGAGQQKPTFATDPLPEGDEVGGGGRREKKYCIISLNISCSFSYHKLTFY